MQKICSFFTGIVLCFTFVHPVYAHQPYIVKGDGVVTVSSPEVSRAYYDELFGKSKIYRLSSDRPFSLYVNLLVPMPVNAKGKYSADITFLGKTRTHIATLDGQTTKWKQFYEEFGKDYYYKGPEYKKDMPAGTYEIEVFETDNSGKYVLAIGEKELFSLPEFFRTMQVLPILKTEYFQTSPKILATSILGIVYMVMLYICALVFVYIVRWARNHHSGHKKHEAKKTHIHIFKYGIRLIFAIGLWYLGIMIWNPLLFFASGCFFFDMVFLKF